MLCVCAKGVADEWLVDAERALMRHRLEREHVSCTQASDIARHSGHTAVADAIAALRPDDVDQQQRDAYELLSQCHAEAVRLHLHTAVRAPTALLDGTNMEQMDDDARELLDHVRSVREHLAQNIH